MKDKGEILIYQTADKQTQIEVRLEENTIWLRQEEMAALFQKDRTVITRHINNVFKEGELHQKSNVQKMHFPNSDKPIKLYSLDVIISVGYRVKSHRGTQFRIWANKVLKDYLIQGYALNERLLKKQRKKLNDLNEAIKLISSISTSEYLSPGDKDSFMLLLDKYSTALNILDDYDHNRIKDIPLIPGKSFLLKYTEIKSIIEKMRANIKNPGYFGKEKDESLKSSISAIYQTFDGKDLYPSIEEKSANLLYFLVKNHSFVDGNKRIAAAIFLYFLAKNKILDKLALDNSSLASLTLMVANSKPTEKGLVVNIVSNLLYAKS